MLQIVIDVTGTVVTIISIVVTIISIRQHDKDKQQKSNRQSQG